jgi:hypothetical protein
METKMLEGLLEQIAALNVKLERLMTKVDGYTTDLAEFSERFEDVVGRLENERRLDLMGDY